MKLLCVLLLTIFTFGCGYGSNYNAMMGGATPTVTQLMPNTVAAGGPTFVLTVNGSGFTNNAQVYWGITAHTATFVSSQKLTTSISAAEIANTGMVMVYVHSNGMNSNSMPVTVN